VKTDNADIRALAKAIQAYLKVHPKAADTLDGVVAWWLCPRHAKPGRREVSMALELLINEGWVEKNSPAGGEPIYFRESSRKD
jgi:hypothetical protein